MCAILLQNILNTLLFKDFASCLTIRNVVIDMRALAGPAALEMHRLGVIEAHSACIFLLMALYTLAAYDVPCKLCVQFSTFIHFSLVVQA